MTKADKRTRHRYSVAEREEILADAESLGVMAAVRKHGVPQTTVSTWRRRYGVGSELPERRDDLATEPEVPPKARVAKRYTASQKAKVLEYASAHSVTEAARHFEVSRYAIYDWRRRVQKAAKGEGPSPTSGPSPSEIEEQRDREILGEWKKHPGLGPSQVRNQLRRRGIKVGVATARRVMEEAGYRPPKVQRVPHDQRYEAVRPNHLWHLDFVHRHIHKADTFTLILIDDHSRFVVGHGVDDRENAAMVLRTFEQAVARHGKPEAVMHDKGGAFWSWRGISKFTALLTELGIDPVVAEAKEHNGKVEVFNANLHKELFDRHRFWDVAEMKRRLAAHLHWYNHGRTHHALGGLLVPADRYYGRAEEVLARIESGALREGDELALNERGYYVNFWGGAEAGCPPRLIARRARAAPGRARSRRRAPPTGAPRGA
jgi:transposase InsO family protein